MTSKIEEALLQNLEGSSNENCCFIHTKIHLLITLIHEN